LSQIYFFHNLMLHVFLMLQVINRHCIETSEVSNTNKQFTRIQNVSK